MREGTGKSGLHLCRRTVTIRDPRSRRERPGVLGRRWRHLPGRFSENIRDSTPDNWRTGTGFEVTSYSTNSLDETEVPSLSSREYDMPTFSFKVDV